MDIKQQILHYYRVEELSLRDISRETGADRKTVTRLVNAFEEYLRTNPEMGIDDFLAEKPKYKSRKSPSRVLLDSVSKGIDKWLKENDRRRDNGMRKQCLKCTDIHRLLLEKGHDISYPSVCKYVKRKKLERTGKSTTLMMAVFAFPYSKGRYAYLFHRQDGLAFMESHRNFFRDINGVPHTMVYDNMRVAVVFDEKTKKPTVALPRMSAFYKYSWRFCNARAGWEKGNVQRSADYVRGRAFTSKVDFSTIEEAQKWLDMICGRINSETGSISTGERAGQLAEELASLKPYPGEFGCFELAEYKADRQATVCVKNNHYSVPDSLSGEKVIVQMYSEKIVIYDNVHKKVAQHARSYGTNEWIVDFCHYIPTLMKKAAAIEYSEAFHQMPQKMQDIFRSHFKDNGKEFLQLVKYAKDNGVSYEDVYEASEMLRKRGVKHFTADHFKVALQTLASEDLTFREDQKTDEFLEIETGSEDILQQLENVMEKGTKMPR